MSILISTDHVQSELNRACKQRRWSVSTMENYEGKIDIWVYDHEGKFVFTKDYVVANSQCDIEVMMDDINKKRYEMNLPVIDFPSSTLVLFGD